MGEGWTLVEYEWDPATGGAIFLYQRGKEYRTIERAQPKWWTRPE